MCSCHSDGLSWCDCERKSSLYKISEEDVRIAHRRMVSQLGEKRERKRKRGVQTLDISTETPCDLVGSLMLLHCCVCGPRFLVRALISTSPASPNPLLLLLVRR